MGTAKQEFRSLFCQRFHCPAAEYEKRAFLKCLPWHARFIAPVLHTLNPACFELDFRFIRDLGATTGWRDVNFEVASFQDVNRARRSLLRTGLRIRVSGRRAAQLAERIFPTTRRSGVEKQASTVD